VKRKFTDKFIKSLKPAPSGKRVEHFDLAVPSFGIRITDRGKRSWILYLRWPGSRTPARRKIGKFPDMPLKDARDKGWQWLRLVQLGIDPGEQERAEKARKKLEKETTFQSVAEAWFAEIKKTQRKAAEVESDVRREFIAPWGARPITSITEEDIAEVIVAKAAETPAQARNLLGYAKRLFRWAVGRRAYGIKHSPATLLRAIDLVGRKQNRERFLSHDELREVWTAAEETEYPYGPALRALILTGKRKSEVGDAVWSEFDLDDRLWTIPAKRMKQKKPHVVPLSDDMMVLLASLPRFKQGSFLFSTTFGVRPANGYSKAKERLDELIGDKIDIGEDGENKWVIHDLRRTVRTELSAIPSIPIEVREAMMAHAKRGMDAVYNHYDYLMEKRHGFQLWASRLRTILQPSTGGNVIELHR
jgi:integrase